MIDVLLRSLFERAAAAEIGVAIVTENTEALRRKAYVIRKLMAEEGYNVRNIKVQISPDGAEIWLVKDAQRQESTGVSAVQDPAP